MFTIAYKCWINLLSKLFIYNYPAVTLGCSISSVNWLIDFSLSLKLISDTVSRTIQEATQNNCPKLFNILVYSIDVVVVLKLFRLNVMYFEEWSYLFIDYLIIIWWNCEMSSPFFSSLQNRSPAGRLLEIKWLLKKSVALVQLIRSEPDTNLASTNSVHHCNLKMICPVIPNSFSLLSLCLGIN